MITRILIRLSLAAALASPLAACTVRGHAWLSTPGIVIVEEQPPPPRHEVVIVRAGYGWVDGNWERRSDRWVWRAGHQQRMRENQDWVPGRWERRDRGHVWIAGTWHARGGRDQVQDHRRGRR